MKSFGGIRPLFLWFMLGCAAVAGADPDAHRKLGAEHLLYTGKDVRVGQTYEAFLISFPGDNTVYLSPSRYRVSYTPNALACRNEASFPVEAAKNGRWWKVSFEVLAIKETAIEDPPSSGKWVWQQSFDCLYKGLKEAE
jgi:hypothetical protein